MGSRNLAIVVYCTIVGFAVLYATNPAAAAGRTVGGALIGDTALLTTATMMGWRWACCCMAMCWNTYPPSTCWESALRC